MAHIVLLGDSIFDNSRYTEGGPDVISQGRQLLPADWRVSLHVGDFLWRFSLRQVGGSGSILRF
jgi:hypothetical protein